MATALLQTDGGEYQSKCWVLKRSSTKTNGRGSVCLQYFNQPKVNHLKKTVLWVVASTNTSRKAWHLAAAVIPADAHCSDSLGPLRFELGSWPLLHWAQPQVPTAICLPTYTKLLGSSFPVASTRGAGWAEEDPSARATRHKQCHHVSFASLGSQPRTHP